MQLDVNYLKEHCTVHLTIISLMSFKVIDMINKPDKSDGIQFKF